MFCYKITKPTLKNTIIISKISMTLKNSIVMLKSRKELIFKNLDFDITINFN